jgi:cytochrome c peroxidase
VKAYGHNGYFKSLEEIVHFYNTRDLLPTCAGERRRAGVDCWPLAEVAQNVEARLVGMLGLTRDEEAALVAFLRTLSDGYQPSVSSDR